MTTDNRQSSSGQTDTKTAPAVHATPPPFAETGITEPKVDATKWSETKYKTCFENFFPRQNSTFSSNVRAFWSKSNNGKFCDGYSGGKYLYDQKKNPNTCKQAKFNALSNGEWMVTLRNGKSMRGIAVCSDTPGTEHDELRDNINTNGNGLNCWCKLTQTDLSECLITKNFSWLFIDDFELISDKDIELFADDDTSRPKGYWTRGENSCSWDCAYECGYKLLDYGRHRQRTMHGVPLIRQYITTTKYE